jgi:hypothetical protein
MSEEKKTQIPPTLKPDKYRAKPGVYRGYDPLQPQRREGHHPEDRGQTPIKRDDDPPWGWGPG